MTILANGIDVSYHNGKLDWEKIKGQIDYAILRLGYGMNLTSQDDKYFEYNASECTRLGIPYGVYLYSYATDTDRAKSEAEHALRLLRGKTFSYPVYYDLEDEDTVGTISNDKITALATTFCNALEDEGYYVGIYANKYWFTSKLTSSVFNNWVKWVAQYASSLTYTGTTGMWQYTDSGKLTGLTGDFDMNHCYVDYPSIIVSKGFNGNTASNTDRSGDSGDTDNSDNTGNSGDTDTSNTDNSTDTDDSGDTDNSTDTGNSELAGDVNGDGRVSLYDALLALRAAVHIITLTDEQIKRADVNNDGKVTTSDALKIMKIAINIA